MLDAATLAIQELLKHYSTAEGLELLQPQDGGSGGSPAAGQKGWPSGGAGGGRQRSRETTPAVVESNLLFSALADEVQVCWGGAAPAATDGHTHSVCYPAHAPSAPSTYNTPAAPCPRQAIVRPYLDSKYQIKGIVQRPLGTLFSPGMSFRKWLFLWLSQLVQHHASGEAHGWCGGGVV